MKRIFTYLLLLALLIAIPAQAQVTYDESKNFSRNLVDVLIHLVNSGGTLVVGGAVDVTMNGDLDVVGDIGAGGDITITAGDFTITLGNAILTDGDLTLTDGNLAITLGNATLTQGDLTLTDGDVTINGDAMFAGGTTGGMELTVAEATAVLAGATTDIAVDVPAGALLVGAQLRVDTLITSGDGAVSWSAAYITGATQSIAAAQAFAQNTKVNTWFDANGDSPITTDVTKIQITPNAGTFSAGVVRAIVYYYQFAAMADAP